MYFSSVLIGIKNTSEVITTTLSQSQNETDNVSGFHKSINEIDTNLNDIFRQINYCLRNLPMSFKKSGDTNLILSVLETIYSKGVICSDHIDSEFLEEIEQRRFISRYSTNYILNFSKIEIKRECGAPFLQYLVEKLEELDELIQRLVMRARLGDSERDTFANILFTKYRNIIKELCERIRFQLRIRTQLGQDGVQSIKQDFRTLIQDKT
jgi:archaellum component FlaC